MIFLYPHLPSRRAGKLLQLTKKTLHRWDFTTTNRVTSPLSGHYNLSPPNGDGAARIRRTISLISTTKQFLKSKKLSPREKGAVCTQACLHTTCRHRQDKAVSLISVDTHRAARLAHTPSGARKHGQCLRDYRRR